MAHHNPLPCFKYIRSGWQQPEESPQAHQLSRNPVGRQPEAVVIARTRGNGPELDEGLGSDTKVLVAKPERSNRILGGGIVGMAGMQGSQQHVAVNQNRHLQTALLVNKLAAYGLVRQQW